MTTTKARSLLLTLSLCALLPACGGPNPAYMPPGSTPPPRDLGAAADMKPALRLYFDGAGNIRDTQMDHQKCAWMPAEGLCDLRCFPTTIVEKICAKGNIILWAYPPLFSFPERFATVVVPHDPKCDFEQTYRLQLTTAYNDPNGPKQFFDCTTGADITKDVVNRRVAAYGVPTMVQPATKAETVSPTRP